jgi:uncharacterized protein YktA (UPF0223 family)
MKTFFTTDPEDIKNYESTLDSVAHELISLLDDREKEVNGKLDKKQRIDAYYSFRDILQAKAQQLYPDFNFENF